MTAPARVFRPRASASGSAPAPANEVFLRLGLRTDDASLVEQIHGGFPVTVVVKLASELGTPQQTVLKIARIAPSTLTRRRQSPSGRLTPEESDRVYRIAAAYRAALRLFEGDEDAARGWLKAPAKAFGGATPLQHLDTDAGAAGVHDLIGRLEHGVYT
ncbi:MAG: DUF2384 domain-containing protein [Chromatiaceae bacterium]